MMYKIGFYLTLIVVIFLVCGSKTSPSSRDMAKEMCLTTTNMISFEDCNNKCENILHDKRRVVSNFVPDYSYYDIEQNESYEDRLTSIKKKVEEHYTKCKRIYLK